MCVMKTQAKNQATKLQLKTETFSWVLNIKEFAAFINLHFDFI